MTSSLGSMGALEASQEHVESALLQIFRFENKQLSRAVTEATFELLITKLLLGILDERLPHTCSGMQPQGSLDVLLFKILDNVDRTSSFVVLISLLRPSKQPSLAGNHKFHKLVIQCLMRYTSVVKSIIHSVDLDSVLLSIHEYLQELGLRRIRRRAAIGNSPLQMILTFLQELVKLLGTAIEGHLSRIPRGMDPQTIIFVYINLYLETLAASRRRLTSPPAE
ncbi:protein MOR1-like [Eucalyptus grandis]|uniref:protein MOR1-like n=1 Tax=Eucalyptus grandis TaxID=71139 RepID=UPI00192F01CF|nr:protein MOR1-like [Eucalyptus grandis]